MGIIIALIGALIVGILARWIYRGPVDLPLWLTVLLGFAGGLLGKSIAWLLGLGFAGGTITAVLGAILLIFIFRKLK